MFRFENLEIWRRAIDITDKIFDLADTIEAKRHYRFADQLRGSTLSVINNIAEGSGSTSRKDFAQFLNYSHRSIFETVNMLVIAGRRKFIAQDAMLQLTSELETISKMVPGFSPTLSTKTPRSPL